VTGVQVTDRAELGALIAEESKAVQSRQVSMVVLPVLLEHEVLVLMNSKVDFLLLAEDSIDPVTVRHIHRLDVVRGNDIVVDSSGLTDNRILLGGVLGDQLLASWVDHVGLHS